MSHIRAARPDDRDALYEICLRTADAGEDATSQYDDPEVVGHIFVGPYAVFEPSLAFVVEDDEGVAGYAVGARDSRAFEALLEREWWPALRERYPSPGPADRADHAMIQGFHQPHVADSALLAEFPSHLHINLLPRLQGQGMGGKIMHTLFDALREQGSPGVHLQVWRQNERAIGFYRHIGFVELGSEPDGFTYGYRL
ncbi:GNAT family N-acetyltransferase [Actinocrispum sp. NPDC049592]|uniref:GNAT family N-acetyltransferase n=1 Tax=Actinocrispum sp. NPDC049592 TaxID=3154835 RepID=UPI00341EF851